LVALAAMAAGAVNALAGGGTLITFPILIAVGLPAVSANVTNTVALCPGYLEAPGPGERPARSKAAAAPMAVPAHRRHRRVLAGCRCSTAASACFAPSSPISF
jgi:hypothetical protein